MFLKIVWCSSNMYGSKFSSSFFKSKVNKFQYLKYHSYFGVVDVLVDERFMLSIYVSSLMGYIQGRWIFRDVFWSLLHVYDGVFQQKQLTVKCRKTYPKNAPS